MIDLNKTLTNRADSHYNYKRVKDGLGLAVCDYLPIWIYDLSCFSSIEELEDLLIGKHYEYKHGL